MTTEEKSWLDFFSRPEVNRFFSFSGLGLALIVVISVVYKNWGEFAGFAWNLQWGPLVLAVLMLSGAFGCNFVTWYWISRSQGSRLAWGKELEIYSFSTVVRRIPGIIWQVAGRTYLYSLAEVDVRVPLWGSLWEVLVQMISGTLLMILALWFSMDLRNTIPGGLWWTFLLLPVGGALLCPDKIQAGLERLRRRPTGEAGGLGREQLVRWIGLYVISWILGGGILFCLLAALNPVAFDFFPVCVGMVAATGVLALAVFIIPGGLGLRDVTLLLLLKLYFPAPIAVAAALLFRLWLLIGEAVVAGAVYGITRGWYWAKIRYFNP